MVGTGSVVIAFECFDKTSLPMYVHATFLGYVRPMKLNNQTLEEVVQCKNRLFTMYTENVACSHQAFESAEALRDRQYRSPIALPQLTIHLPYVKVVISQIRK